MNEAYGALGYGSQTVKNGPAVDLLKMCNRCTQELRESLMSCECIRLIGRLTKSQTRSLQRQTLRGLEFLLLSLTCGKGERMQMRLLYFYIECHLESFPASDPVGVNRWKEDQLVLHSKF